MANKIIHVKERNEFNNELLRYGNVISDSRDNLISRTFKSPVRIRVIEFEGKVWFSYMEDGDCMELFSVGNVEG